MGNIIEAIDLAIGAKIMEVLKERKMTQAQLARAAGITPASVHYLMTRHTVDVRTLVRVSRALKHNFLKYYYVDEEQSGAPESKKQAKDEKDFTIEALKEKIATLEKENAELHRKMEVIKMEDEYLKEINLLLKKNRD
jgi:transcriptional regulator with XRE-family HTH domain